MNSDGSLINVDILTWVASDLASSDFTGMVKDAVLDAGWLCRVIDTPPAIQSGTPHTTDIVVVDARQGIPASRQIHDALPVLALVDADQSDESMAALNQVDAIANVNEVGSNLFLYRIKRLVDHFQNPLSLERCNKPEFDLIKALVNTSHEQIYIKDVEHRFLFVSDLFVESNNLNPSQVIGKNDLDIGSSEADVLGSPELGLGFWQKDDAAVEAGITTVEENPDWRALLEDTKQRRVYRVPLKNHKGEVYALIVCSCDATDTEFSAVDIKARGEMLNRVLGEMQKAQESQQIAELAEVSKNKLLAAASHDLRQPLHAMGLFLDVLERRVHGEQEQDLIAKIKRSSDALSVLFNSLLDISRLDAGVVDVDKRHFVLEELLRNLRPEFQEIGLQKSLAIEIPECDHTVHTDPILFERILRNLVQNAVTYTNRGSVQVDGTVVDNGLCVRVTDTGPGIPLAEQGVVFSEYYQMEGRPQTHHRGLGLGLAIVRRLASLLNLKIELDSDVGRGSIFSVTVPIGDPAKIPATLDADDALALNGMVIVIIDDEKDICEGMADMLLHYDCVPISAESVEDALTILIERDIVPGVIVADFRLMYDHTGEQAIAEIREEFSADIPAIIVTGDTSADRLKDATRSGCQLLHKPVQPAQLVRAIADLIG